MALTPGTRFGRYEILSSLGAPQVIVVQHWTEELKRLVPTK